MQALTDDPKEKGKTATKEKFTRFYDLLEEVLERHKIAPVLEDDDESREQIGSDVIKFVIPSLKAFTQKQKEKEFSKSEWFCLLDYCVKLLITFPFILFIQTRRSVSISVHSTDASNDILFLDIKMSADEVESRLKGIYR
jgi:hypothetical protein